MAGVITVSEPSWIAPFTGLSSPHFSRLITALRCEGADPVRRGRPLQALATPSRLYILARLQEGPCSVSDLVEAVGMEASACSHLLRNLGLVTGERHGRSTVYTLYGNHVAELLDQALYHVEHLPLGVRDVPAAVPEPCVAD